MKWGARVLRVRLVSRGEVWASAGVQGAWVAHYYPRKVRTSTSQRSSAFKHRSSPTHAFGILLALVYFLISIFFRAVRARSPSSRCRHHRHPRCHQHPIDHPQLPLCRRHSSGEFPDTCALSVPTWQYYYICALSPPFCPALCSCPPTHSSVLPPPHTSASARTPPLPLPQNIH